MIAQFRSQPHSYLESINIIIMELNSLSPDRIFETLSVEDHLLAAVQEALKENNHQRALSELLACYRNKFSKSGQTSEVAQEQMDVANKITKHIFQWGPYEEADYGDEMDWAWDPAGDIEWVAGIYRFYWAPPLANAFEATGDEKYAETFVQLTSDWIRKHPLESRPQIHPVYKFWKDFPWLDIQTGIRATNICQTVPKFVHAEAFTPEFLGILLASLYDHQVKTEFIPMNKVHNKAIFEQRGFINIAYHFSEFKDSRRWLELALERTEENLLAQTTEDGVQREWSGGYHTGVLRDAIEIRGRMLDSDIPVSNAYEERIRGMFDYIFWMSTPDLGYPMFGDCSRSLTDDDDRSKLSHFALLKDATDLLGDPKYAARADLNREFLPEPASHAFHDAGMYALRNDWGPDQIYMAVHNSPKAISSHDQPDNGTFELYAYGRWLMPDSGFYTYGHDPEGRAWHRQTSVHQTLTLNAQDSVESPKELKWVIGEETDVLSFENKSYEGLTHRRTIWFVDHSFFIFLDEAIGDAEGDLDLHFQFAPGEVQFDVESKTARTLFDDANVVVQCFTEDAMMEREEGWFAWSYGYRKERPAFRFRKQGKAPCSFLTMIVPFSGTEAPGFGAEQDGRSIYVKCCDREWELAEEKK
jgi:heparan-sulfate lyase